MNRKILQFQINEKCFVVLCDDGSLWSLGQYSGYWNKLPPIPSDEEYASQQAIELERLNMLVNQSKGK